MKIELNYNWITEIQIYYINTNLLLPQILDNKFKDYKKYTIEDYNK